MPDPLDPSYWLDHFNGNEHLAAFVVGSLTRRPCPWCERELRPCNMKRHITARHFRQLTIDDMPACPHCGDTGVEPGTIVISDMTGFGFNSIDPDPLDRGSYVPCTACGGRSAREPVTA